MKEFNNNSVFYLHKKSVKSAQSAVSLAPKQKSSAPNLESLAHLKHSLAHWQHSLAHSRHCFAAGKIPARCTQILPGGSKTKKGCIFSGFELG